MIKLSKKKLADIKLVAMDVDGTFTDGTLYYDPNGEVIKGFHTKDGMGLELLRRCGIVRGFITGRHDSATESRANYLKVDFYLPSIGDKSVALQELAAKFGVALDQCLYMGDDYNDLTALKTAGFAVVVADASEALFPYADYVTQAPGGKGAVREMAELVLKAKGIDPLEMWMSDRDTPVGMQ